MQSKVPNIGGVISPTILTAAALRGVKVFQSFVVIINNQLYLLQPIEITPQLDLDVKIPYLNVIAGPVNLELPNLPNIGPDYNELQP
ncbi:hypothetical protein FA048_08130 [Pedobacter polaris]|uniref:Uncharacterized protein n=1 Tax=Pedobacter polaris TaxID=2571273 RepID=A0A4U1CW58_9SPHI|nr:hypothetical protein [Pedobacter polaris]TKC10158.1 hypothetical protein FA048_08130 [Pedobacter polaris]